MCRSGESYEELFQNRTTYCTGIERFDGLYLLWERHPASKIEAGCPRIESFLEHFLSAKPGKTNQPGTNQKYGARFGNRC